MKRSVGQWAVLLFLMPAWAGAQTPAPLLHQTFEDDAGGWQAMGPNAKVSVTHEAANVKEGKGALKFDYTVDKNDLNVLILPTPGGALTKMKSLRFWVKSGQATSLVASMQEKNGGRYSAVFSVPKDTWQQVELTPSDFMLGLDKNDPKDPDNKLDLDQVEGIGITDFMQILQRLPPELATLLQIQGGSRTLYLDDVTVGEEALPNAPASPGSGTALDSFAHPQADWIAIGDTTTVVASGKPLEGRGLKSAYRETPGTLTGWIHVFPTGTITNAAQLTITLASEQATHLRLQVEEVGGGKYYTDFDVSGGSERKDYVLPFADFKPAEDSNDPDGRLDLDQVHQVVILDPSGMASGVAQSNTLWFNNLRVTAAK